MNIQSLQTSKRIKSAPSVFTGGVMGDSLAKGLVKNQLDFHRKILDESSVVMENSVIRVTKKRSAVYHKAIQQILQNYCGSILFSSELGEKKKKLWIAMLVLPNAEISGLVLRLINLPYKDPAGGCIECEIDINCSKHALQRICQLAKTPEYHVLKFIWGIHAIRLYEIIQHYISYKVLVLHDVVVTANNHELIIWKRTDESKRFNKPGYLAVTAISVNALDKYQTVYDNLKSGKLYKNAFLFDEQDALKELDKVASEAVLKAGIYKLDDNI